MNSSLPPRLAKKLLTSFLRDDLLEEVNGDLEEKFNNTIRTRSRHRAQLNYWYQVIHYMRPFAIGKRKFTTSNSSDMFRNYLKIGVRNLVKNKGYSFINIGGLAIGLTVAIVIGLWINDELSYDTYHPHQDKVAQIMQHQVFNGYKGTEMSLPIPLHDELQKSYGSDFKYLVLMSWMGDHILTYGDTKVSKIGNYMDIDAPRLLSLTMLEGTYDGLKDPGSVLLSRSSAKALFGEKEPMGEMLRLDTKLDVKVTGVYEDLPFNSQFRDLAFIAPWELYVSSEPWVKNARAEGEWGNNSFQLFAQIADNADMEKVSAKIKNAKYDRAGEGEKVFKPEIFLHPMSQWHLKSNWENGVQTGGFIQYVWLFGIVGIFVLLLACINFMNLSTARSEQRVKEVGIRKSVGSVRSQLIGQFLSESLLVVLLAFAVSLVLVYLSLPWFNQLADKRMSLPLSNLTFWSVCIVFTLVTGFLSGSYPALYLSSFKPVNILKGTFRAGRSASLPRKVLVVLQFTVSVTLVIGTIIVYQQVQFSKNRPIGYDTSGIMMIQMKSPDFYGKYDALRNELKSAGIVEEISESSSPLTGVWSNNGGFNWEGKDPALQAEFATIRVTHDFGKAIGWKMLQGRDFSREHSMDTSGFIINEAAVKFMGLENPLGKVIRWGDDVHGKDFTIIGVSKDLLMESPFKAVKQTIYLIGYDNLNWIELKLNPAHSATESIAGVEGVFKKILPNVPFDYKFADAEYAQKFRSEERVGQLSSLFATLAIIISCLGLFGLASFVAEQRTKEIGIRKVLGASVVNLWQMLSKDFLVLVVLACIIAIPAAYYLTQDWLNNYEYHAELSWWIFAASGSGALIITLLTVSYQAIRAAMMNPVNSLRSE